MDQESQETQKIELEVKLATRQMNKAKNLFGEVVDNYKLDQMDMYMGKPKTREDRAREALNLFDEDGKDANASRYLFGPKHILPAARIRSTYCFIYNAIGDTIYHVAYHEWSDRGFVTSYPARIGNGQWGAFRHCQGYMSGSMAAVVYRGKNKHGEDQDYLFAWSNPFDYGRNKVIHMMAHWVQSWALLLPLEQRDVMASGCIRLLTVVQDILCRAGWRHTRRLQDA